MWKRGIVYLAGPITGCTHAECTDWRHDWVYDLSDEGIICFSPMRAKAYLAEWHKIPGGVPDSLLSGERQIMSRDHFDCNRADVLVVNVLGAKVASIGTAMEAAWAFHRHVPQVWIIEPEGNPHDHAMLRQCMNFRTTNQDDAKHVVRSILNPYAPHYQEEVR